MWTEELPWCGENRNSLRGCKGCEMLWHSLKNRNSECKRRQRRRKRGDLPAKRKRRKSWSKRKLQQSWRNNQPQKRRKRRLSAFLTPSRLKTIKTRIPTRRLGMIQMRHRCKRTLCRLVYLVTSTRLTTTLHCNWSRNWNQMKTQSSQRNPVTGRSKKKILEGLKENQK